MSVQEHIQSRLLAYVTVVRRIKVHCDGRLLAAVQISAKRPDF